MAKLTLSIDNQTISQAKKLADEQNTSVSSMFTRFIQSLSDGEKKRVPIGPLTKKATGVISLGDKDYKDIITESLRDKYGL